MNDITQRLTYANVLQGPMVLREAIETIEALRAELDREKRWIRTLEQCLLTHIKADHGRQGE
jgi:hypothetical protein